MELEQLILEVSGRKLDMYIQDIYAIFSVTWESSPFLRYMLGSASFSVNSF